MKIKIPAQLRNRLEVVGVAHALGDAEQTARQFVIKGLQACGADASSTFDRQLAHVVDEQGYASADELVEHLLVRGLRAYEEPSADPKQLEARLRGLGYID